MSHLLARLLMALAMLVGTPVVYMVVFLIFVKRVNWTSESALVAADLVTSMTFGTCWVLIWRRQVQWTVTRRMLTCFSALGAAIPGLAVYGLIVLLAYWNDRIGIVLGGLTWCAAWIPLTAIVWRETALERVHRLHTSAPGALACPKCGYNMTGLHQARCPECGTQFTLDELVTAVTGANGELPED